MKTIGIICKKEVLMEGVSASGVPWMRQTIVIVQDSRYMAVDFFGARCIEQLKGLNGGDLVEVGWFPSSVQFGGRWYTNLVGSTIAPLQRVSVVDVPPPDAPPAERIPPDETPS